MTEDEKELFATIKIAIIRGIVEMKEDTLLNLVKKVLAEMESEE